MKENIGRKVWVSIKVVFILVIIGLAVFFVKRYYNSEVGKTKIYKREISDVLNLEGNKALIKILKSDINDDENEDYIVLLGEEKFENDDTTTNTDIKKLLSNVELYNNVCVDFIDGKSREVKRYETKKFYGQDVNVELKSDKNYKYIWVTDKTTGNISLLYLKENELKNLITKSFSQEFCGYTIEASFGKDDVTKLEVNLDNYGRDYLKKQEKAFTLDYVDTNVNNDNYRLTYMANRFCEFEIVKDENENLELIGIQHILYSNKPELEKNSGKVKTHFKLDENKKLVFKQVEVVK